LATIFGQWKVLSGKFRLNRTLAQEPGDVVLRFGAEFGREAKNEPWLRIPMPAFGDANPVVPQNHEAPAPDN
jgi:hypothetical protein